MNGDLYYPLINIICLSILITCCYYPLGRYEITSERPEHKSATCLVYRAVDILDLDGAGNPRSVAVKLMRFEAQYRREILARLQGFDSSCVMPTVRTHEPGGGATPAAAGEGVEMLSKEEAESYWALVMPMADRNLFVAIKQERFAGVDMHQVALLIIILSISLL